jgi:hypothetical protein
MSLIHAGTTWTKHYYIRVFIINLSRGEALLFTNFTGVKTTTRLTNKTYYIFNKTSSHPAIYRIWATDSNRKKLLLISASGKAQSQSLYIKTSETKGVLRIFSITQRKYPSR